MRGRILCGPEDVLLVRLGRKWAHSPKIVENVFRKNYFLSTALSARRASSSNQSLPQRLLCLGRSAIPFVLASCESAERIYTTVWRADKMVERSEHFFCLTIRKVSIACARLAPSALKCVSVLGDGFFSPLARAARTRRRRCCSPFFLHLKKKIEKREKEEKREKIFLLLLLIFNLLSLVLNVIYRILPFPCTIINHFMETSLSSLTVHRINYRRIPKWRRSQSTFPHSPPLALEFRCL